MRHTSHRSFVLLLWCIGLYADASGNPPTEHAISAVVIDLSDGHMKTVGTGLDFMTSPGSTLKPFLLFTALRAGVVAADTRMNCSGTLRVGGRNLSCAHPHTWQVLDAQQALAYSCNSYFAQLASRMPPSMLSSMLRQRGFAVNSPPNTPDDAMLLALGLDGVWVSPRTLARAYVSLAEDIASNPPEGNVVRRGLIDSVQFGMARGAQVTGVSVGGKTGTAHDPAPWFQHGWFAGIVFSTAPPYKPQRVIAVYAPGGNGNDAALAARAVLQGLH